MRADPNKNAGNGRAQDPLKPTPVLRPDELADAARDYFSADFSNPERLDCPPPDSFESLLRAKALPSEELRQHLFGCSECFREYRAAVELCREAEAFQKLPARRESPGWRRLAPAYALLAACALVASAVFFTWRGGGSEQAHSAGGGASSLPAPSASTPPADTPSPNAPTPAAPAKMPRVAPEVPAGAAPAETARAHEAGAAGAGRRERRGASSTGVVVIDLAGYSLLRADDGVPEASRATTLPPALSRLRILLPEGSPRGVYRVAVVDAFGNPLTSERAAWSAGRKIEVSVDTRNLSGRRCRLRVSHGGEAPDYYPINVNGR